MKHALVRCEDLLVLLLGRPVWRGPAAARATVCTVLRRHATPVAADALRALGSRSGRWARWRFQWSCSYHQATQHCLWRQRSALTDAWIRDQVVVDGSVPPGGAILLTIHHAGQTLGGVRLAQVVNPCGVVTPLPIADDPLFRRTCGTNVFAPIQGMRAALRFLERGGYLFVMPDACAGAGVPATILRKRYACAPGIVWLAQRSGKPILPCVVIPDGTRWRAWIGAPVAATHDHVARAVEECIRRAPTSWWIAGWLQWHVAPRAPA